MADTLDTIADEKSQTEEPVRKSGWGGKRTGSGPKPKKAKRPESASQPSSPDEPMDPDVQALLDDTMAQADLVFPQLAQLACFAANPDIPPSAVEIKVMATTAKPVAFKYIGGAAQYLGLEGVFALAWLGILIPRWMRRKKEPVRADEARAGGGAVGDGQEHVREEARPA